MRALCLLAIGLASTPLWGEEPTPQPATPSVTPAPPASEPDEADVETIREQYWAKGRKGSIGVVQNRNHPRRNRLEVSVEGGTLLGDPSLSIKTVGATVGFHVTELVSFHADYFKAFVGPSSILRGLLDRGTSADTNEPREYIGAEGRLNIAYGKLALAGSLVYLDSCLAAGAGRIATESGGSFVVSAGLGQHFHLGKTFSLNLDYRLMAYREFIPGKIPGPSGTVGQTFGPRTNLSHRISLSLSVFFNFDHADPLAPVN